MRVLVTGSTGFVGSALVPFLTQQGHDVARLVRRRPAADLDEVEWDPLSGTIDVDGLSGTDAVVHLAGENIAAGRWTPERKSRIHDSRVNGTRLLSEALASLDRRPEAMICASAKDIYGDRGGELLKEDSGAAADFLARSIDEWEASAHAAVEAGIRVVNLRLGLVLGSSGGALAKLLPLFKLGVGGRLGNGRQYLSWVSLGDVVRVVHHALVTPSLRGPVNVAAPGVVTNGEFARTLGRALSRPALIPAPALMLRLVLGEVATTMLASARLDPAKLLDSGFEFLHADLEEALEAELGGS